MKLIINTYSKLQIKEGRKARVNYWAVAVKEDTFKCYLRRGMKLQVEKRKTNNTKVPNAASYKLKDKC